MAVEPTPDPLDRALRAARDEQPEGWIELSQSIMSRVRSLGMPSDPVLAFFDSGTAIRDVEGSRTFVSARVITNALRSLLQAHPSHAPQGIRLNVEDERLTGIEIKLVGSYGVDLKALADSIRSEILIELELLMGPDPDLGIGAIGIEFVDIVEGDPNLI